MATRDTAKLKLLHFNHVVAPKETCSNGPGEWRRGTSKKQQWPSPCSGRYPAICLTKSLLRLLNSSFAVYFIKAYRIHESAISPTKSIVKKMWDDLHNTRHQIVLIGAEKPTTTLEMVPSDASLTNALVRTYARQDTHRSNHELLLIRRRRIQKHYRHLLLRDQRLE